MTNPLGNSVLIARLAVPQASAGGLPCRGSTPHGRAIAYTLPHAAIAVNLTVSPASHVGAIAVGGKARGAAGRNLSATPRILSTGLTGIETSNLSARTHGQAVSFSLRISGFPACLSNIQAASYAAQCRQGGGGRPFFRVRGHRGRSRPHPRQYLRHVCLQDSGSP